MTNKGRRIGSTNKQVEQITERVLRFIIDFKVKYDGNTPTIRDIETGMGFSSTSIAMLYVNRLISWGYMRRMVTPDTGTVHFCVVGGQWEYCPPEYEEDRP